MVDVFSFYKEGQKNKTKKRRKRHVKTLLSLWCQLLSEAHKTANATVEKYFFFWHC